MFTIIRRDIIMGIKDRRRNIRAGGYSRLLVLPAILVKGEESTLAANRLLLVDPRGEISEGDLLHFLESVVEPNFWPWYKQIQDRRDINEKGREA